jgi:hypothetical protein
MSAWAVHVEMQLRAGMRIGWLGLYSTPKKCRIRSISERACMSPAAIAAS